MFRIGLNGATIMNGDGHTLPALIVAGASVTVAAQEAKGGLEANLDTMTPELAAGFEQ